LNEGEVRNSQRKTGGYWPYLGNGERYM